MGKAKGNPRAAPAPWNPYEVEIDHLERDLAIARDTIRSFQMEVRMRDWLLGLERLAEIEHEQWASWAASLLESEPGMSEERRKRWSALVVQKYADLPEAAKEQDREWARRVRDEGGASSK